MRRNVSGSAGRARPMAPDPAHLLEIDRRLREAYGVPPLPRRDPLDELILTILSQNTNDRNRDQAYQRLRAQFPTWEAVRDAPEEAVIEAIRPAGLAPTKGPRLQAVLRQINAQQGRLSLDFLRDLPPEAARSWLLAIPGVGPKTAAIVLLFSLGVPAFPVDTHIHRVTQRLGLIPPGTSREAAHTLLEALIPPALYGPLHLNLIELGRRACHARHPDHEHCPVRDLCPLGQRAAAVPASSSS